MWGLKKILVALCCIIINGVKNTEAILEICQNLKAENVTLEEFARTWITVEAYLEFGVVYQAMHRNRQRMLSLVCESVKVSLAEANQDINETHATGFVTENRPGDPETYTTRNVTFRMPHLGVLISAEGLSDTIVALSENKDYITMATCERHNWFDRIIPLTLFTYRSANADYNETSLQEIRAKNQNIFGYENITPIPYSKNCSVE